LSSYDFEIDRALKEVGSRGAKRVLIQAPDGLKQYVKELHSKLRAEGITAVVSANPCYGGCDLAEDEGAAVGADLVLHIGHLKFSERADKFATVYLPAPHIADVKPLIAMAAEFLGERKVRSVGLVANTQHLACIVEFKEGLERAGIRPVVDGASGGLVLGCRTGAASRIEGDVDAILFIGGGEFHALGVAMAVDKDVYAADPYRTEIRDMGLLKRKTLARRWWAIMEAAKAKSFGIVVVAKSGQFDMDGAMRVAGALEERGREVFLISTVEASWDRLSGFSFVDAFIITGCPRVSVDNQENFPKPVLAMAEAEELLKRV